MSPPYVIVVRLPDDVLPAEAKMSFPPGSMTTMHGDLDAKAILALRDMITNDVQTF